MAKKFKGTLESLKDRITNAGIEGEWNHDTPGKHVFRARDGGILNWWPSNGSVQVQGQGDIGSLEAVVVEESQIIFPGNKPKAPPPRQIFIVHGHDGDGRDQLELALRRLGVDPFVLMNSTGEGKTIIEALEGQIGRDYSTDFGIVLMTPDDVGYAKKDGAEKAEPRARQNVILETGMLLSSLTRSRIAIVVKGHVELPSDLEGIIRFHYNEHIREIVPKLAQRLKEAGFDVSAAQVAAAAQ